LPHTWCVLAAAGAGSRLGAPVPKALVELNGEPVFMRSLRVMRKAPFIMGGVVVAPCGQLSAFISGLAELGLSDTWSVIEGGATRQQSVFRGLRALPAETEVVIIHDAARPLVDVGSLRRVWEAAVQHGAAACGWPVADTLKQVGCAGRVQHTLDRGGLWAVQTPQAFRREILWEAHQQALDSGFEGTDDAQLVEMLGHPVYLVKGSPRNIKITYPEDLEMVQHMLGEVPRVGLGYDIHPLVTGRRLVLGGVYIDHPLGLDGHSDADVVCHALADALLGAAGLGDIGVHFPVDDPSYRNASSIGLLAEVGGMLRQRDLRPSWVDLMVLAESPKLSPYFAEMRRTIAEALGVASSCVSIKATTAEGLPLYGDREAIACWAVAVVCRAC